MGQHVKAVCRAREIVVANWIRFFLKKTTVLFLEIVLNEKGLKIKKNHWRRRC
jgi:hypothetical protein